MSGEDNEDQEAEQNWKFVLDKQGGDEIQEGPVTALAHENIQARVKLRIGKVEMRFALFGDANPTDSYVDGPGLLFLKLFGDILTGDKFRFDPQFLGNQMPGIDSRSFRSMGREHDKRCKRTDPYPQLLVVGSGHGTAPNGQQTQYNQLACACRRHFCPIFWGEPTVEA